MALKFSPNSRQKIIIYVHENRLPRRRRNTTKTEDKRVASIECRFGSKKVRCKVGFERFLKPLSVNTRNQKRDVRRDTQIRVFFLLRPIRTTASVGERRAKDYKGRERPRYILRAYSIKVLNSHVPLLSTPR